MNNKFFYVHLFTGNLCHFKEKTNDARFEYLGQYENETAALKELPKLYAQLYNSYEVNKERNLLHKARAEMAESCLEVIKDRLTTELTKHFDDMSEAYKIGQQVAKEMNIPTFGSLEEFEATTLRPLILLFKDTPIDNVLMEWNIERQTANALKGGLDV